MTQPPASLPPTPPLSAPLSPPSRAPSRNLRSAATDLCRQAAAESGVGWRAVLLDLRNHGKSAALGLHPPHTLAAAARDVIYLFKQVLGGAPDVLVGHSLGGKTALEVVRQLALAGAPPVGQPRQVWVLDARPTAVHTIDQPTQEVLDVLQAVEGVPLPLASRKALYAGLEEKGMSVGLQQWLGSSLREERPGELVWTFNVHGAQRMFDDYLRLDYSSLLRAPPAGVNLHILRAMRSGRWDHDTLAVVRQAVAATAQPAAVRGRTWFHELADAGHWVHAENPKGMIKFMLPSLLETAGAAPTEAAVAAQ